MGKNQLSFFKVEFSNCQRGCNFIFKHKPSFVRSAIVRSAMSLRSKWTMVPNTWNINCSWAFTLFSKWANNCCMFFTNIPIYAFYVWNISHLKPELITQNALHFDKNTTKWTCLWQNRTLFDNCITNFQVFLFSCRTPLWKMTKSKLSLLRREDEVKRVVFG